ncbi:hypothetical protein J6590_091297 [Homalodisca vitripennis]|nr:hypothetical protein J6590_086164 [Homalodisca vitripennis]KAG8284962.1 hypothetical protein J6590_091297 [Homalodisca vitripennis]
MEVNVWRRAFPKLEVITWNDIKHCSPVLRHSQNEPERLQLYTSQTTHLHLISGCTNNSIYRYARTRLSGAAVHVSNNPLHLISGCTNNSIYRYAGPRLSGAAVHVQLYKAQTTPLHLISGCTNNSIYRYAGPRLSGVAVQGSNNPPSLDIWMYQNLSGAAVHGSNNPPSLDVWMYQQCSLLTLHTETVRCSCTRLKQLSFT